MLLKVGEIYCSVKELKIDYLTHCRLPYTGGGKGILQKHVKVYLKGTSQGGRNTQVFLYPVIGRKVERNLIPKADRLDRKFDGYTIIVERAVFEQSFRPYSGLWKYIFKVPLYRWLNQRGWL